MLRMSLLNGADCDIGVGDVDSRSEPWESAPGGACHGPNWCGDERGARAAVPWTWHSGLFIILVTFQKSVSLL